MTDEIVFHHGTTMVRRLRLSPGEAMPWHRDPFHRVAVVLGGDLLSIEYRNGGESHQVEISPGGRVGRADCACSPDGGECRQAALRANYCLPARPPRRGEDARLRAREDRGKDGKARHFYSLTPGLLRGGRPLGCQAAHGSHQLCIRLIRDDHHV
jgi:hypothetical protein